MTVDGYTRTGDKLSGTIRTIALCRCKPRASANPTRPSGVNDDTIRSMTLPAGTCGNGSYGGENTVPITLTEGRGEARTSSGEFAGASIKDATLLGWLDADGDGTEDAVVSFVCFGSTFDMCCAGRSSMMKFLRVFDFFSPDAPARWRNDHAGQFTGTR
ncbi:hypothetical protein M4D79_21220 [Mycolicibacterium novocastrense]|nr:hypothetical protein M4D79_21220 [Mycolicibacterium novocastrense]